MWGFSIGATLGSVVDAMMQPGVHVDSGRLTDLSVTGSSYGTPLPITWGKTKVGGQLIWSAKDANGNQLIQHKSTQHEGGKGGGMTVTNYWYTATFAIAVCKGDFLRRDGSGSFVNHGIIINKIWADDLIVYDSTLTTNIVTPTIYSGSETQNPDPTMQASMGSAGTPAYRGLCYFVIQDMDLTNWNNRIPNFAVEIDSAPQSVGSVMSDIGAMCGLAATDMDLTAANAISIWGYQVNNRVAGRDALKPVTDNFFVDVVEVDGVLSGVPRGGAVSATISIDDMGAGIDVSADNATVLTTQRMQDTDLPGRVDVTYFSISEDRHFEQITQGDIRQSALSNNYVTVSVNLSLLDDYARQLAARLLDTAWTERNQYQVSLLPKWVSIAPADVLNIPIKGNITRVRVTSVEIGIFGEIRCAVIADDAATGTQVLTSGSLITTTGSSVTQTVVPTDFIVWSGTELRDVDQANAGFYTACTGADGWSGAVIYYSTDSGTTWLVGANAPTKATFGTTAGVLPDWTDSTTWDMTSSLPVVLDYDTLSSTSQEAVLNGVNGCVIGNEIAGFATATLTSAQHYTLSTLRRGFRKTSMVGHASGERFVMATTELVRVNVPAQYVGQTVLVKAVSTGQQLSDVTAKTVTIAAPTPTPTAAGLTAITGPEWLLEWNETAATPVNAPVSAPTVAPTGGGAAGGLLAAGNYYAKYTITTGPGETTSSPESAQFTVSSGNKPRLTFPGGAPSSGQKYSVYMTPAGGASGTAVLYASGVTGGTYDATVAAPGGIAPPTVNTSAATSAANPSAVSPLYVTLALVTGDLILDSTLGTANPLGWGMTARLTTELIVKTARTIQVTAQAYANARIFLNNVALTPDLTPVDAGPTTYNLSLNAGVNTLAVYYNNPTAANPISFLQIKGVGATLAQLVDAMRAPETAPVGVQVSGGSIVGVQPNINLIPGTGFTGIGAVNNPSNHSVDVTFNVSLSSAAFHGTKAAPSAVSVTITATQIIAANSSRKTAYIANNSAVTVYIGKDNTVTTVSGVPLAAGNVFIDNSTTDAWYGIVAAGTADVRPIEVS